MIKLDSTKVTIPDIGKELRDFADQLPRATAQAITFTAERVQKDLTAEIESVYDNPTPFTKRSVYKTTATASRLYAEVKLKDEAPLGTPAAKYLQPTIEGSTRGDKGMERALKRNGMIRHDQYMVPGDDVRLNQYGNITRGQIVKALSNVKGQIDSSANTGSDRSVARQKRSGRQYFWMPGKGIFWRQSKKSLRSFMVVASRPDYEKLFDFFGVSERSVAKHLPEQVQRSIDRVLRKAQEGGGTSG